MKNQTAAVEVTNEEDLADMEMSVMQELQLLQFMQWLPEEQQEEVEFILENITPRLFRSIMFLVRQSDRNYTRFGAASKHGSSSYRNLSEVPEDLKADSLSDLLDTFSVARQAQVVDIVAEAKPEPRQEDLFILSKRRVRRERLTEAQMEKILQTICEHSGNSVGFSAVDLTSMAATVPAFAEALDCFRNFGASANEAGFNAQSMGLAFRRFAGKKIGPFLFQRFEGRYDGAKLYSVTKVGV